MFSRVRALGVIAAAPPFDFEITYKNAPASRLSVSSSRRTPGSMPRLGSLGDHPAADDGWQAADADPGLDSLRDGADAVGTHARLELNLHRVLRRTVKCPGLAFARCDLPADQRIGC